MRRVNFFAYDSLVHIKSCDTMALKGIYIIRQNVEALIRLRGLTQTDIAGWLQKDKG